VLSLNVEAQAFVKLPANPIAVASDQLERGASLSNIYFTVVLRAKNLPAILRVLLYCRTVANAVCSNLFRLGGLQRETFRELLENISEDISRGSQG
jgi:hypothetical protein